MHPTLIVLAACAAPWSALAATVKDDPTPTIKTKHARAVLGRPTPTVKTGHARAVVDRPTPTVKTEHGRDVDDPAPTGPRTAKAGYPRAVDDDTTSPVTATTEPIKTVHARAVDDPSPTGAYTVKTHPRAVDPSSTAAAPAATLVAPPPCQPFNPPPDEVVTEARFNEFAFAFLVAKDITWAFTYISKGYINHNPLAQNGSDSAWGILSPIWASQNITVLNTTFSGNTGWLQYRSDFGEIVDRFRWDAGCIVEHWDQGEVFPTN